MKELIEIIVVGLSWSAFPSIAKSRLGNMKGSSLGLYLSSLCMGEHLSSLEPSPKSLEKVM
jgi:hypothetical protein